MNNEILVWDIELIFNDLILYIILNFFNFIFYLFNFFDPFLYNGLCLSNSKFFFNFAQNMSFFFGLKFIASIGFLVLIRGGTPRYRYDFLTKLGWLKFLGLIIFIFFFSLIFFFIF